MKRQVLVGAAIWLVIAAVVSERWVRPRPRQTQDEGRSSRSTRRFSNSPTIAIDSKGNLYTAEAEPGNRFQKFVFKGLSSPSTQ
jgi:hypothetical protein